ncbi:MAG: dephospho-CoA kinase [Myxococcota bacterium]|jgi:dephospho-CoA kinase|nr:dephospho-CoA kinase [Myxococcota bacterium]
MTWVIGLTGGIACGKSLVAGILRSTGVEVIDADEVARQVVAPGSALLQQIVARFGPELRRPDGTLARDLLGQRIFANPDERRWLEQLLHPAIGEQVAARIGELGRQGRSLVVYEAALLVETGLHARLDRLIVVTTSPELQLARLVARGGLSREEAARRIAAQLPQEAKVALADLVIDNRGTPAATRQQTLAGFPRLVASLASPPSS